MNADVHSKKKELESDLKEIEDEMIDIEHWIEFSNFNAVQGYKASQELKRCREKRRSIKNELLVLDIILEQNINDNATEEVLRRVRGIDNRSYLPRVRTDLFFIESEC